MHPKTSVAEPPGLAHRLKCPVRGSSGFEVDPIVERNPSCGGRPLPASNCSIRDINSAFPTKKS
jgi:hypothetical protein